MKRVLLEYREERSEDVEDKIQDMIRAAVYKYRNGMDSQDTFQNVYLDYLEKFKDTEDEWFRDPRNLRILAVSFKNKIFDLYDMYKRRYKTQVAMPSSGIEEYTTRSNIKNAGKRELSAGDQLYREGHDTEARDNPRNKEEYSYKSSSKAWDPASRIDSPKEMQTRSMVRDMAHLVNNYFHTDSGEYAFFFGMLSIVDALQYVKDIIPTDLYKKLSHVETSSDISQKILGIGRPGHSKYMRIADNVRKLLKSHGYSL